MPQARGTETTIALYDESSYGVTPGTPAGKKIYVKSCGVKAAQPLEDSATLSGGSRSRTEPARQNIDVAGSVPMELHAESLIYLLKHAFGTVNTSGTNPYTHTFTIGNLPAGFIIEKD